MNNQYKELQEDILYEEELIEETLGYLIEVKHKFEKNEKDSSIEPAMGTFLMNFYNGVERILKCINREYYHTALKGEAWHKNILDLSYQPPSEKVAVFDLDIVEQLQAYRKFRHRFVSGYGFQLKGEKMLELVNNIEPLWSKIKKAVAEFLAQL